MFLQLGVYDSLNAPVVLLVACIVYNMDERLPVRQTEVLFGYLMMRMKEVLDRKFGKKLRQVVDLEGKLCCLGELSWRTLKNDKKRYLLPKVCAKVSYVEM